MKEGDEGHVVPVVFGGEGGIVWDGQRVLMEHEAWKVSQWLTRLRGEAPAGGAGGLAVVVQCGGRQQQQQQPLDGLHFDLSADPSYSDLLGEMRLDAADEFRLNGVESTLDEYDVFRCHARLGVPHPSPPPPKGPHDDEEEDEDEEEEDGPGTDPVDDYMSFKERRKAARPKLFGSQFCVFCKNNGECSNIYSTHVVKDEQGKVACPVLRRYKCPVCGARGDDAHTVRYCPQNNTGVASISFLKTARMSTGKMRRY